MGDVGVVFRRVHGRVIAIRDNNPRKAQTAKGVGQIAAGAGTAAAAGHVGQLAMKRAAGDKAVGAVKARLADSLLKRFEDVHSATGTTADLARKLGKTGASQKRFANVLFKSRNAFLLGAIGGSAYLIGKGIKNTYKGATGKELDKDTALAYGSAAAATGVYGMYYRGMPAHKILANAIAKRQGRDTPHKFPWFR